MSWDDGGPIDTLYYNAGACFPELICGHSDEGKVLPADHNPEHCTFIVTLKEYCNRTDYFRGDENVQCLMCGHTKQVSEDAINYLEWMEEAFQEGGY